MSQPGHDRTARGRRIVLAALAGLVVAGATPARAEVGLGAFTSFPLLVGVEAAAGVHQRWEVAVSGGVTPAVYVDLIQGLAEDPASRDLLEATLQNALGLGLTVRLFVVPRWGIYLAAGYDLLRVGGKVDVDADTLAQGLEDPDTGSDLPHGGGGSGGSDPSEQAPSSVRRELSASIQLVRFGLGYRRFFGKLYLQGELGLRKAFAASITPTELQEEFRSRYTDNLLVPSLDLACGLRF